MSDDNDEGMAEVWAAMREEKRQRHALNKERNHASLKKFKFEYQEKNDGEHVILRYNEFTVDFWPSSGKWIFRGVRNARGYGMRKLMSRLGFPSRPGIKDK